MHRYLLTLRRFWSTALAAEMEYRANFILAAINSVMSLAGAVFVLWTLFRTGYQMGGWTWPEALLVVAAYTILDGFQQTFLAPNRQQVSEAVREGTLDFILIKPMDTQFWLSTRKLRVWGVPNLLLGVVLLIFAWTRLPPPPPPEVATHGFSSLLGLLAFIPAMAVGLVILYALGFIFSTVTVWFVKMDNITVAMQSLLEAGRYPVAAYPAAYRVFFTFVLPVAFMTTVPAEMVIGRSGWQALATGVAVAAGLLVFSRWFWRFALRYYTSASS